MVQSSDLDMAKIPGWEKIVIDNKERLHRELRFEDFSAAFGFMTQVAMIAERLQHHPEWFNVYNIVIIDLYRHETGDITEYNLNFAQEVNRILDGR